MEELWALFMHGWSLPEYIPESKVLQHLEPNGEKISSTFGRISCHSLTHEIKIQTRRFLLLNFSHWTQLKIEDSTVGDTSNSQRGKYPFKDLVAFWHYAVSYAKFAASP